MSSPKNPQFFRRRRVYIVAAVAAVLAVGVLLLPGRERLHAAGPANTGHEKLACAQCHTPAEGTLRQQVQANVRHLVGRRDDGADFVHRTVGNVDCVACHANEEDTHPAFRFNEARFAEVRATLAPQNCVSCHAEHSGKRVNVKATFCSDCHQELEIRDDPVEPSHSAIIQLGQWQTCLSCHDYHGNHVRAVPERLDAAIPADFVTRYLDGGPPIYGRRFRFPAKTERGTR